MPNTHLHALADWHPVFVEGMGGYDQRDPAEVSAQVCAGLSAHWQAYPTNKPKLLITQGDPLEARGIAAISRLVSKHFSLPRCLVCLDEHIADYHAEDADRDGAIMELRYLQLANAGLTGDQLSRLTAAVEAQIKHKNEKRAARSQGPLKSYFRDFALLQEASKAACRSLSGSITVAHTSSEIHEFSVTSFYTVGLALGYVATEEMVAYSP